MKARQVFVNFRSRPVKLVSTILYTGIYAYGCYAVINGAVEAGHADELWPCGFRSSLFFVMASLMMVFDWLAMMLTINDPDYPNAFAPTKQAAAAVHKGFIEVLPGVIGSVVLMWVPVVIWLWKGAGHFIGALVLMVLSNFLHHCLGAFTFTFWATHNEMTQAKFTTSLVGGEFTFEQAITAYAAVNKERKAVVRGLKYGNVSFICFLLVMAIVLYDFEIRPWGGWVFMLIFITFGLGNLMAFQPWLALHEWPNELCQDLMESTELRWEPSEKNNFLVHVSATKVRVAIFDFEMSSSFNTALPLLFFGWFLYMTELKQFHGFMGFPFDQVCFNATEEEGGGHGHELY